MIAKHTNQSKKNNIIHNMICICLKAILSIILGELYLSLLYENYPKIKFSHKKIIDQTYLL